jgi:serum response factor
MLLVASETGHVYTFATRKLQPMITSESGKALIQTCLNSPDPAINAVTLDQRMSATGYEEPDLSYSSHDGVNVDKVCTFILDNNESFKLYFVVTHILSFPLI